MKHYLALVLALSMSMVLEPQTISPSRANDLFEMYKTSVVKLHVTGRNPKNEPADAINGTGFFITPDGYLVTALHVVKKDSEWLQKPDGTVERTIEVSGIDANNRPILYAKAATVTRISEELDIAVLKTNVAIARPLEFAKNVSKVYSAIYGLGWQPDSQMPDAPVGTINTSDSSRAGDLLRLSNMLLNPANSGAPVFDSEGAVIGVAIGVSIDEPNVALARSSVQFRKLLPGGIKIRASRPEGQGERLLPPTPPPQSDSVQIVRATMTRRGDNKQGEDPSGHYVYGTAHVVYTGKGPYTTNRFTACLTDNSQIPGTNTCYNNSSYVLGPPGSTRDYQFLVFLPNPWTPNNPPAHVMVCIYDSSVQPYFRMSREDRLSVNAPICDVKSVKFQD